jgi:acyl carrier protein
VKTPVPQPQTTLAPRAALSSLPDFTTALSRALGIRLRSDDHLVTDLRFDSLEMYEVLIVAEDLAGVEIPDDRFDKVQTVSDLYGIFLAASSALGTPDYAPLPPPVDAVQCRIRA